MDWMIRWIKLESTGHCFFYAFPIAVLALLIWFKGRRLKFLLPALIMSVVIVNPVFYRKWDEMGLYAYWRVLWVLPVIPVIAAVVPSITEKIRGGTSETEAAGQSRIKTAGRILATAAGVLLITAGGTFIYHAEGGDFVVPADSAKLPDHVVDVAERLLELNEHPRVIIEPGESVFQPGLSVFIRQYSGRIDTMYGRDLYGFMKRADSAAHGIADAVKTGDWDTVRQVMLDDGYDYLVTGKEAGEGFELVDTVAEYGIYSAVGTPRVIKERNELGQVTSITTVDENGMPVNGDSKYATVSYEYDEYGRVSREFHTDVQGKGVPNLQGVAGYEKAYDTRSNVIMERMLGPDGVPVAGSAGYVEVRRIYEEDDLIQESYFDGDGNPVERIDTCYASVKMEYDEEHNRTAERYFDTAGIPVRASSGYAMVKRTYEHRKMTEEAYFDEDGSSVNIAAGYASKKCAYDEMGNVSAESYFDGSGMPVNCINGYARMECEYDGEKNIVMQRFLDADDHLVVTGSGYAEVHRMYQGSHLTRENYYGADGEALTQPAGYCAIEQVWNGNDLFARIYLGPDGFPADRTDGYARAVWEPGDTCTSIKFYDVNGKEIESGGLNLAEDIKSGDDGWSDWMIPNYNAFNSTKNLGYVNLGTKTEGDRYTCQLEIEFKNVSATEGQKFRFFAQGAQDGKWGVGNIWNNDLIDLKDAPEDGIYTFTVTNTVSGQMMNVSTFNLGFRSDYWASGAYRVRCVKIQKGDSAGEWIQGV